MKFVVRFFSTVCAIALIVLSIVSFVLPAELVVIFMAIVGFSAGVLIVISVEWWIKEEKEYERKLKRKEQRVRLSTHA